MAIAPPRASPLSSFAVGDGDDEPVGLGFELGQIALMTTLPLLGGVVSDTLGGIASDAIFRRTGNIRLARRTLLVVGLGGALVFMPAIMTDRALP